MVVEGNQVEGTLRKTDRHVAYGQLQLVRLNKPKERVLLPVLKLLLKGKYSCCSECEISVAYCLL